MSYRPLAPSQRLAVFMMRWWSQGTLTWCSPKKTGILAGLGRRNHGVMFQALKLARALNEELTSSPPPPPLPQCIAVKTSYIDMSSRFTAPHCLSYYQAINSRAGMNWLTLRVASVASCNLIPYIICPSRSFFHLKHTRCQINAAFIQFVY